MDLRVFKSIQHPNKRVVFDFDENSATCVNINKLTVSIQSIENFANELVEILENKNISAEEKQDKLESLNQPYTKNLKALKFKLPQSALAYVERIESLLSKKNAFDNYVKNIKTCDLESKKSPNLSLQRLGPKRTMFLEKYLDMVRLFDSNKESIGLAIVYCISEFLKSTYIQEINVRENIDENTIKRINHFNMDVQDKFSTIAMSTRVTPLLLKIRDALLLSYRYQLLKDSEKIVVDENILFDDEYKPYFVENLSYYLVEAEILQLVDKTEDDSPYNHTSFIVKKEFVEIFLHMCAYTTPLPNVIKPNDWKIVDERNPVNFGGYLMNSKGMFPGIHLKGKNSSVKITQEHVDGLNYLQGVEHRINKKLLYQIINNYGICLYHELNRKAGDWAEMFDLFVEEDNSMIYTLRPLTAPPSDNFNYSDKKLFELKKKKMESIISKIHNFHYTITIAFLFENHGLWFRTFFDMRGRVFVDVYGPSPQGGLVARSLIRPVNIHYDQEQEVNKKDIDDFVFDSTENSMDFWKRIIEQGNNNTVRLDVTCSGLQIMSGLCGLQSGLEFTNFLRSSKQEYCEIQDLYKKVMLTFIDLYLDDKTFIKDKPMTKLKHRFRNEINRDFIKGWTMRYMYSESHYSRVNYLVEEILYAYDDINLTHKNKYVFAGVVSKIFIKAIKSEFGDLCKLSEFLQTQFLQNVKTLKQKTILIESSIKSISSNIDVTKQETKKFKYYVPTKKRYFDIMLIQNTEKLNVIKVKHSIVPHLIHQLDAEILSKVVKSCKEHEIKLSTVHDCFVVNRLDQEKVKTFFFQAFLEAVFNIEDLESETLSLEKHPILHLFLRNFGDKITDQDVLTQLILKYRKKQYEIYRNIKNGTLIKNTHILKE